MNSDKTSRAYLSQTVVQPHMTKRQRIISYWLSWLGPSLASGVLKIASMAATFLIMILLGRRGGTETLGLFSLGLTSLQLVVLVVGFGLPNYLMRQVAWSRSHKVSEYSFGGDYFISFWFVALWGAIVCGGLFAGSAYLSEKLFHNVLFAEVLRWTTVAIVPYTLLVLQTEVLRGLGFPILSQVLQTLLISTLTLVWILAGPYVGFNKISASIAMAGYASSSWAAALVTVFCWQMKSRKVLFCQNPYKKTSFFYGEQIRKTIKRIGALLRKGSLFLVAAVAMTVMAMTDTLMLGMLSSVDAVGSYSAASRLAGSMAIILFSVNNILAPKLGHSYADGDMSNFSKQVHTGIALSFWPTLLAGGILLVFSSELLALFGNEFEKAALVMQILVVASLINALCGPVGWVLCMTGHESTFQRILLASAGLNIILNAILIPQYGAIGAAIATAVCTALWNILAAIFVSKYLGVCTIYGCNRFLERHTNG
jgi:O-antigen/teichoic acid export membrane protein